MFIHKTKDIDNIGTIYQRILNEKYYSYEPPADFIKCVGDFYLLDYFNYLVADKKRTDIAPTHFREDDDLKDSIVDAYKKLIPYLKKTILGYAFYSISSEMITSLKEGINPFNKLNINNVLRVLLKNTPREDVLLIKKFYKSILESPLRYTYAQVESIPGILNELGISNYKFVELAKICFAEELGWAYEYAGKNWQNICDAYLRLDDATSFNETSVAIDHVIDLQHNTGSVFSKILTISVAKLENLLDLKSDIRDYRELLIPRDNNYYCSGTIRTIGYRILKERENLSKTSPGKSLSIPDDFRYVPLKQMKEPVGYFATCTNEGPTFSYYEKNGNTRIDINSDPNQYICISHKINNEVTMIEGNINNNNFYLNKYDTQNPKFFERDKITKSEFNQILIKYDANERLHMLSNKYGLTCHVGSNWAAQGDDKGNVDFCRFNTSSGTSSQRISKAIRFFNGQYIFLDKIHNSISLEEWNGLFPETNFKI
jgi:hypothetical protein